MTTFVLIKFGKKSIVLNVFKEVSKIVFNGVFVMELKDIRDKRINTKLKLHEAIDKYGIKSDEVLKMSRELDILIVKEMELKDEILNK